MVTIVSTEILGEGRLAGRQLGAEEVAHTIERYHKRIETAGSSFRGQIWRASGQEQLDMAFPTLSEAGLAAVEIQRRITDLPPVSGVRLNVRLGIHEAATEGEAQSVALQLMKIALPGQILCGREILLDQVYNIGVRVRDLHQIKLENGSDFQVTELLWHDEIMPASLTATSVLSLADIEEEPFPVGGESLPHSVLPPEHEKVISLPSAGISTKLCVRYQGKAFLLDEKTPFVTLGREYSNDLVIDDARISRQHARIERKENLYYLVDTSTNGTFVQMFGKPEKFLRKENVCLDKGGVLSLGASMKRDGVVKKIEFEFL
jgi:hypothetical protein